VQRLIATKIILALVICIFSANAIAQKQTNTDSLYLQAREYAFQADHEKARNLCDSIISISPNYTDARILSARTYAWAGDHDKARAIIATVIKEYPNNLDAYLVAIDNEIWTGNFGKSDKLCRVALEIWPSSSEFLVRLAATQYNLAEYQPALSSVDTVLAKAPGNKKAIALRSLIIKELKQDKVKVGHSEEWFNTPFSRRLHITSIEYLKKANKFTFNPRITVGQALMDTSTFFSDPHLQTEIDLYYQISGWNYLYFNYGYGFKQFFPRHRQGLEFFQKLPLGFEASLGYRFLYFAPNGAKDKFVDIYTASIGKYWKGFWFSGRAYLTPKQSGADNSYQLVCRFFYNDNNDFAEISASSGFSVDESVYAQQTFSSTEYLKSYRIGINGQYTYKRLFTLHASTALRFEEYWQNKTRTVYYAYGGISFFL